MTHVARLWDIQSLGKGRGDGTPVNDGIAVHVLQRPQQRHGNF